MTVWGGTSPLLEITTARSITTNSLQGLSSVARLYVMYEAELLELFTLAT